MLFSARNVHNFNLLINIIHVLVTCCCRANSNSSVQSEATASNRTTTIKQADLPDLVSSFSTIGQFYYTNNQLSNPLAYQNQLVIEQARIPISNLLAKQQHQQSQIDLNPFQSFYSIEGPQSSVDNNNLRPAAEASLPNQQKLFQRPKFAGNFELGAGPESVQHHSLIEPYGIGDILHQDNFKQQLPQNIFLPDDNLLPQQQQPLNEQQLNLISQQIPRHGATKDTNSASRNQLGSSSTQVFGGNRVAKYSKRANISPASFRPQKPSFVNLSSLVKPGQVLLSKKANEINAINQLGAPKNSLSTTSVGEIENILEHLRPLSVTGNEKVIVSNKESRSPNQIDVKKEEREIVQNGKRDDDLEDNSDQDEEEDKPAKDAPDPKSEQSKDDLAFLNILTALENNSKRRSKKHRDESVFYGSNNEQQFIRPSSRKLDDYNLASPSSFRETNSQQHRPASITIDWLVDQLLSRNRRATFGSKPEHNKAVDPDRFATETTTATASQNGRQLLPALDSIAEQSTLMNVNNNDDEDDDDEEDDEEGDEQPSSSDGSEVKVMRPDRLYAEKKLNSIDFSSIANNSNSWIPLNGLNSFNEETKALPTTTAVPKNPGPSGQQIDSNEEKRKRKMIMKREKLNQEAGLVIGNKKLTRAELFRLIKILNKMASQKKASKEREASRRLMRSLIKLALDNYHKHLQSKDESASSRTETTKLDEEDRDDDTGELPESRTGKQSSRIKETAAVDKNNEDDNEDPIKDSLRSLLVGPEVVETSQFKNSSQISIRLQPWSLEPMADPDPDKATEGEEDEGGGDGYEEANDAEAKKPQRVEQEPATSKQQKKIGKILSKKVTEDLDKYLDGDFFEDMADKRETKPSGGNQSTSAGSNLESTKPVNKRMRTKGAKVESYLKETPKSNLKREGVETVTVEKFKDSTKTPRILDQRQIDLADENDVDLDANYVRLTDDQVHSAKKANLPVSEEDTKRRKRNKGQVSLANRMNSRRANDDDDDEDDRDGGYEEHRKRPTQMKKRTRKGPRKRADREVNDKADSSGEEREDPRKENPRSKIETKKSSSSGNKSKRENAGEKKSKKRKPKRKRKRRRRQQTGKTSSTSASNRRLQKTKELERDEIPAPIVAGVLPTIRPIKSNRKLGGKLQSEAVRDESRKKKVGAKYDDDDAQNGQIKREGKMRQPKADARASRAEKRTSEEPRPNQENQDSDYYIEGTSFAGQCEEDGNCQIKLETSNPEIGKALKSGARQPTIVKQLDSWIRDEPD